MEDKELPGFKINDYSGDGDSDATEEIGGVADGSMAAGDGSMAAGDGSVAEEGGSMPAENGPVTHGEGEIKPVMVENVSEGGSEEKALKTAPEGVGGQFAGSKVDSASGAGVDQSGQITEAEARAMLIEDNARAKEALKKANNRGKKTLVAVIALAVLLVVAGVATSIILGGMKDDAGNGDKQEGNGDGNSAVVEKPEKPEVVELSLDDELVQGIYGNFQGIARLFDGWWGFYLDDGVKNGEFDREKMLLLAGANYPEGVCAGYYEYGNGGVVTNECVSGEAIRQKIAEMFGQGITLVEGDKVGAFCGGKHYDVANDEFHQAGNGCGGASSARLVRVLEKAEQKGDEIYLYEKVLLFDALEYYHFSDINVADWKEFTDMFGEKIGAYEMPTFESNEEYNAWLTENERNLTVEYGEEFKWTFWKDAAGNYVFEGLTRVE